MENTSQASIHSSTGYDFPAIVGVPAKIKEEVKNYFGRTVTLLKNYRNRVSDYAAGKMQVINISYMVNLIKKLPGRAKIFYGVIDSTAYTAYRGMIIGGLFGFIGGGVFGAYLGCQTGAHIGALVGLIQGLSRIPDPEGKAAESSQQQTKIYTEKKT